MGCTGSRLCSPAQQDATFEAAAKEMLVRCITISVASTDSLDRIQIPLPPEIQRVIDLSVNLRTVSSMAKSHLTSGQGGIGAAVAAERASGAGGMLHGFGGVEKDLFSKAAVFVDKAAEALGAGIGMAAEKAFIAAADGLDQCVKDLEGPFNFAGRGFVWNSREPVIKVYASTIERLKLQKPVDLVRGERPHGPAQFKACSGNSLSAELCKVKSTELVQALMPLALDTLARNKIQDDWDSLMWKYDQAKTKLQEYVQSESFRQSAGQCELTKTLQEQGPIEFDLNTYVVEQTVQQLASLMGQEEAKLRADPVVTGVSKPVTFHLCFSSDLDGHLTLGKPLPFECYQSRNK